MEPALVLLLVAAVVAAFLSPSNRLPTRPSAPPSPKVAPPAPASPRSESVSDLIDAIWPRYREAARPAEILEHPPFQRLVALFASDGFTYTQLLDFYNGQNAITACAALEALAHRSGDPDVRPQILEGINSYVPFTRFFALRAIDGRTADRAPLVGDVLIAVNASWLEPINFQILRGFVAARVARGERPTFGDRLGHLAQGQEEFLVALLERLGDQLVGPLRAEIGTWSATRIDTDFLSSVGRIWPASPAPDAGVLEHPALLAEVANVEAALLGNPPRSVLLVGHRGVGKTSLVRVVARRLQQQGYLFFEAGASELVAGQIYIGSLEERMQPLR